MDVVYDIVESIYVFIPIIAVFFFCGVLYLNNKLGLLNLDTLQDPKGSEEAEERKKTD